MNVGLVPDIVLSYIYTNATCVVLCSVMLNLRGERSSARRKSIYVCFAWATSERLSEYVLPSGNPLPKAARRARIFY